VKCEYQITPSLVDCARTKYRNKGTKVKIKINKKESAVSQSYIIATCYYIGLLGLAFWCAKVRGMDRICGTQQMWVLNSVGIDLKELGGSGTEMFEISPMNWSLWPIFTQKWASVDKNWGWGSTLPPTIPTLVLNEKDDIVSYMHESLIMYS